MTGCVVLTGGWAASMQVHKCLLCGLQLRLGSWLSCRCSWAVSLPALQVTKAAALLMASAGRAKDTIVLSNGENVEPQPIEDALCASPLIKFAGGCCHLH